MPTRNKPAGTLCVEAMLAAGADSSWLDEEGRSPLQRAATVGSVPCIEALLRSPNTKVNAVCDSRSTALLEAVRAKSAAVVRTLTAPPASASVAGLAGKPEPLAPLNEAVKANLLWRQGHHSTPCRARTENAAGIATPADRPPWLIRSGEVTQTTRTKKQGWTFCDCL